MVRASSNSTGFAALAISSRLAQLLTDENTKGSIAKAVQKKQEEVTKRLTTLQAKLEPDQLSELRKVQNTYTLLRSADGLGMTITPECDIETVAPGSHAAVRCPCAESLQSRVVARVVTSCPVSAGATAFRLAGCWSA